MPKNQPQRRRSDDPMDIEAQIDQIQDSDIRLLAWQVKQYRDTAQLAVAELKSITSDHERRLQQLEIFKAGLEAANKLMDSQKQLQPSVPTPGGPNDRLLNIIFIVLGLLGTALGLISSGVIHK